MTKRLYISPANWNAPFRPGGHYMSGLGAPMTPAPSNRSYQTTAWFRAPYQNGYYQDGSMQGLGDIIEGTGVPSSIALPGPTQAYLRGAKEPEPGVLSDINVVVRQIPTWFFIAAGIGLTALAYSRHKQAK